ncbi:hypothetical protein GCM10009551_013110 [Nocardiopsis tropica]
MGEGPFARRGGIVAFDVGQNGGGEWGRFMRRLGHAPTLGTPADSAYRLKGGEGWWEPLGAGGARTGLYIGLSRHRDGMVARGAASPVGRRRTCLLVT